MIAFFIMQAGRRLAGYDIIHEGGIAPIMVKCIPPAEVPLFKVFATQLLQGPALENDLKWLLALVLLLRHPEVSEQYPQHSIVTRVTACARSVSVPDAVFQGWISKVRAGWKQENTMALSLHQVKCFHVLLYWVPWE